MSLGRLKCSTCGSSLHELPLLSFDASATPPHHDLLTANDQPRQQDVQTIENCVQDHESKASELDKLLKDIKQACQLVDSRRQAHIKLAEAYKGTLSAIRKFPAELLEEIFLLCVRSCPDAISPRGPPWVLGKVCRRWRSIVIYLKRLSTSLRLSRTFPLRFELFLRSIAKPVCPVLDVISPHMNHCQSLKITTTADNLPLLDQAFRGTSCSMRSLAISLLGTSDTFSDYQSLSTFQRSLNIRDLRFHGPGFSRSHLTSSPFMHSWLRIPWGNLTSFVGGHLQVQFLGSLNAAVLGYAVDTPSSWSYSRVHYIFFCKILLLALHPKVYRGALNDMVPLLASLAKAPLTNLILDFDWETSLDVIHLDFLIGQPLGELPFLPHLQHITMSYPDSEPQPSSRSFNRLIECRLHLSRTLGTKPLETVTLRCADLRTARAIFNDLEGWQDNSLRHGQVPYTKISDWLRVFRKTLGRQPTLLENKRETRLHEVFLEIEQCDYLNISPMFIHRSTICDYLRHITELPDTSFGKEEQYQLRQRASIIIKRWKDVLREYLGHPGWSMRKQDDPSGFSGSRRRESVKVFADGCLPIFGCNLAEPYNSLQLPYTESTLINHRGYCNVSWPSQVPHLRFPTELLEEIFLLCVRSCSNAMSSRGPPWVLGKLWSVIPLLSSSTGTTSDDSGYLKRLSTSLRLSRTFPLHFELSLISNTELARPVFNVIYPYMNHWVEHLPLLDQAFRGTTCSIRSLAISLRDTSTFSDYQSLSTFQLSPNIRDLRFSAPSLSWFYLTDSPSMHSWLKIPWSNLTSFVGDHLQVQYVTDLLHHAPSLVECSFTGLTDSGMSNFMTVDHGSLCLLDLSIRANILSSGFLDYLTLPFLATLSIPLASGCTVGSMTSFFARSSCSLSTLKLTGVALNGVVPLMASLEKAPLTNLILEFVRETSIDAIHLDFLIGQPSGEKLPFLPHLQHITIAYPGPDSEPQPGSRSFTSLDQLIESRLYLSRTLGTKPLETVTLRCTDFWTARAIFDEVDGWPDNSPRHGQVTYLKISDWLRVFKNTLERQSALLENKGETSLHEVILEIEQCDYLNISPMFIHRFTICDHLRRITELPDTSFEREDRYQLRQRASIILKCWKDVLREYLGRPGWSMRKQDAPLGIKYALFYSTAGRDYHTFPPF
ncbi:uncharacterized protein LACBIDRAFT_321163 [Laccaria bicolor S238N-H82]|uniref:Predicted protein n=1 Tax=Laccaria bicolor (strain S238N-H82 / ATCC MYA-4686) TaxID=486041 RepID=B0CNY9_LACBS|nr:uncharacterized protein LACBIDRAFT_321163 [Laccaria bicolor S238N-H82]EDR15380.1 predicted protein [Laccaria bicolor S238N-H82]|eukprot:XP_001873588.1 predicted protein [Laccaria bicolor S238N-H82]